MKEICETLDRIKAKLASIDCGLVAIEDMNNRMASADEPTNTQLVDVAEEVARSARIIAIRAELTANAARQSNQRRTRFAAVPA